MPTDTLSLAAVMVTTVREWIFKNRIYMAFHADVGWSGFYQAHFSLPWSEIYFQILRARLLIT